MINTGIPECPTIESIQARVEKMMGVYEKIKSRSNYNFDNVAAVESYCPGGKSMDVYFSATPIAEKHRVALEEMSRGIMALIAGAIVAVIAAIFKIYKFFTSDSSSGSGGSSNNGPTLSNSDDAGKIVAPEEAIAHTIEVVEPEAREFVTLGQHASPEASHASTEGRRADVAKRIEALGTSIESRSPHSRKRTNCIFREQADKTVIGLMLTGKDNWFGGLFAPRAGGAAIDSLQATTDFVKYCTKMLGELSVDVKSGRSTEPRLEELKKKTQELFKITPDDNGELYDGLKQTVQFMTEFQTNAKKVSDERRVPVARQADVIRFFYEGHGGVLSAPGRFIQEFNIHNIGSAFFDLKKHVAPLMEAAKALKEYQKAFDRFSNDGTSGNDDDDSSMSLKDLMHGANLKTLLPAIQIIRMNVDSYVFAYNVYIQEVSAFLQTYREICTISLMHPEDFVKDSDAETAEKKIKELREQAKKTREVIQSFTNLKELSA